MPQNQSFNPGGWLDAPAVSSHPRLDLRIRPRMNLYLSNEKYGSVVVDAAISYQVGKPLRNLTTGAHGGGATPPFSHLFIDVMVDETGLDLVNNVNVTMNTTGNEFVFSFDKLRPRLEPYQLTLTAGSRDGAQFFKASTEIYYVPQRNGTGSVARLDNMYGGLWIQTSQNKSWSPVFPYSFYVTGHTWPGEPVSRLNEFKAKGYNIIHLVPDSTLPDGFHWNALKQYLDRADEIGLYIMYDMRYTYMNHSSVRRQVEKLRNHPSLLLWYTGDEPDGATDPLNATRITYDLIKRLDPYHPISECLNCYNFYYQDYASGADIVMPDPYPISDNTSYSHWYGTVCNTTYGCCGCDDCNGNFEDISTRLDRLAEYDIWLGSDWQPKTRWIVPQGFGDSMFWSRVPTEKEEVVMGMLGINHNAKGVVAWQYPTTKGIEKITSKLAKVITASDVTEMLLGANAVALTVSGQSRVDAAAWVVGDKMLVSVINLKYEDSSSDAVEIELPVKGSKISEGLWGSDKWLLSGSKISKSGLTGLEVDLLVLDVEGS